jgi:hypothetical protein
MAAVPASSRHVCSRSSSALGAPTAQWDNNPAFASAAPLELTHWDWPKSGPEQNHPDYPHPQVQAKAVWDDEYLGILFAVDDHYVQCKGTKFQDMVCMDSCMEFFVTPLTPHSDASTPYFNFEVSANGTMLLYYCTPGKEPAFNPVAEDVWPAIKMKASLVEVGTPIEPELTDEHQVYQIECERTVPCSAHGPVRVLPTHMQPH